MKDIDIKQTEIGEIPEDWRIVTIPDVASNFDNKRTPLSSAERSKIRGQYPYYGAAGIIDYVNDFKYEGNYLLIAEDGTVTSDGNRPMLQLARGKFWVSNHAHVLQCKSYKDTLFLYYQLKNTSVRPFITGAVQPKLSQENLNKIKFLWIENDDERGVITKILFDLDEKIELNHQMNKTLESITQAIFKRWFVDFEFPGYKKVRFVDDLPKGWHHGALGEIITIESGKRPGEKSETKTGDFTVPLIGASSVTGFVKDALYNEPILIIGRVGTHGVVQRVSWPSFPSDNTLVIRPKHFEFVYQILKTIDYESLNVGTTQPLITQTAINKYGVVIPSNGALEQFEAYISGLFKKVVMNNKETESLVDIRDSFLPRLMSGRLCIN